MAGKVLSMEIGQGMTRVVEVDYQAKAPKIYNAFSLETPKDMVQDGVITRNEDFIINLKVYFMIKVWIINIINFIL